MPVLSVSLSSHVMMICPPALYQMVTCTCGMNFDKKASPCWTVPSCSSSMRFGVYQTKLGGITLLRSGSSDEASAMGILVLGKYSQGKWRTAYSPALLVGLVGRFSA